jgi:hypothetical protein
MNIFSVGANLVFAQGMGANIKFAPCILTEYPRHMSWFSLEMIRYVARISKLSPGDRPMGLSPGKTVADVAARPALGPLPAFFIFSKNLPYDKFFIYF